jgi:hypothetical protein
VESKQLSAIPTGTAFTLNDIRVILADSIRELRAGSSSPANINALSNATGKILSSVKLEMEYYKAIGRKPQIDMIIDRGGDNADGNV